MIDVTTERIRNFHALARNSLPSPEGPNGGTLTPPTQALTAFLLNKLKNDFYFKKYYEELPKRHFVSQTKNKQQLLLTKIFLLF